MATGFVGQQAAGVMKDLVDADPSTEGAAPPESVTYESSDPLVAAVAAHPDDQLKCTVLLLAPGTSTITCTVDPGAGEPWERVVDVEALAKPPGEAVGGTFELGEFEPVA